MAHTTVLLQSSIDSLNLKPGDIFLDATINGGGHSELVAKRFGSAVRIIGIDADEDALKRATERLTAAGATFSVHLSNFRHLDTILTEAGVEKINAALFDIGLSSNQLEAEEGRGFSFQKNEPLLMTFKKNPNEEDFTAAQIVNSWEQENLEQIIRSYGEERYARSIAAAIVQSRESKPIQTTFDLVDVIRNAVPGKYQHGKIHFATRTFQALRITVNDELRALKEGIEKAFEYLIPGGRMAVISFHSLEDRIVKHYFKKLSIEEKASLISKKPITPTIDELNENRRARSAKLRVIQKN